MAGRDEEILSADALAFVAELDRRFDGTRRRLLRPGRAPGAPRRRRAPGLPAGDARACARATGGRARPRRPAGPPRRDHRAGRPQDDHQRAQLRRPRASWPTSRTRTRRRGATSSTASEPERRGRAARSSSTRARRATAWATTRRPSSCGRAAGTSRSATSSSTASRSPASLFDFGLFFFHNARRLLDRGSGPYFYLPKTGEPPRGAALERRLRRRAGGARPPARHDQGDGPHRDDPRRVRDGRDPLRAARALGRAQLRALGLHLQLHQEVPGDGPSFVLPDRAQVTMTRPFLRAYTQLLVQTCHRRGAHAMGGMAAQIPIKERPGGQRRRARPRCARTSGARSATATTAPGSRIRASCRWRRRSSTRCIGRGPNQIERLREEVDVAAADLLDVHVPEGAITEDGLRQQRQRRRPLPRGLAARHGRRRRSTT